MIYADVCKGLVDDSFILYLFQRIEELSDDASDPYHSAIIRVLVGYICLWSSSTID